MKIEHALLGAGLAAGAVIGFCLLKKPVEPEPTLKAELVGYHLERNLGGHTTERRNTGQQGVDFRFYPILQITPDVNGDFTIRWDWQNYWDGNVGGCSEPTIEDVIPGLTAGQTQDHILVDNRPENDRQGAIAIGDVDFQALGIQDGNWHEFRTDVGEGINIPNFGRTGEGKVTSPTGAVATFVAPNWINEDFRSWGELSAGIVGQHLEID